MAAPHASVPSHLWGRARSVHPRSPLSPHTPAHALRAGPCCLHATTHHHPPTHHPPPCTHHPQPTLARSGPCCYILDTCSPGLARYVPDDCALDSIRGSANALLQRNGGGDVRVLMWGDSLVGQLMTALRSILDLGLILDHFHAFLSSASPCTRRVMHSTWCHSNHP